MSIRLLHLLASYVRQSRSMSFVSFAERKNWILSRVSLIVNRSGDMLVNLEDLIAFIDDVDVDVLYNSV